MLLLLNVIANELKQPSVRDYIFGTADMVLFCVCLGYAYLGMLVRIIIDIHRRNPNTTYSPAKFDWRYFWCDNVTRFIVNIFLVAIAVRFIPDPNFIGKTLTPCTAFMVGFGSDFLAQQLKNKEKALLGDTSKDDTVNQ